MRRLFFPAKRLLLIAWEKHNPEVLLIRNGLPRTHGQASPMVTRKESYALE
jgi:hypothetical protein